MSTQEIEDKVRGCIRRQLELDNKGPYSGLKKLSDYQYAPTDFDRFLTDIQTLLQPAFVFTIWNDTATYFTIVLGGLVKEIAKQTKKVEIG